MAVHPKRQLHELIDRLKEDEALPLSAVLRQRRSNNAVQRARPLTEADIMLTEPLVPDDETDDKMIAIVRRWSREGGHA